jgi:non-ribosomal peptide synthetase component F
VYLLPTTTSAPSQGVLSHVRGDVRARLNESTLGDCFEQAAAVNGDRPALVVSHQAVRWTYAELHTRVTALAAGLLRLGLRPGERIGIWSQNCAEWVLTQFATAKAGLVLVNINPAYRAAELPKPSVSGSTKFLRASSSPGATSTLSLSGTHQCRPTSPAAADKRHRRRVCPPAPMHDATRLKGSLRLHRHGP